MGTRKVCLAVSLVTAFRISPAPALDCVGSDDSKCSSFGGDCCANGSTEKQTCRSGYIPVPSTSKCWGVNRYKCCKSVLAATTHTDCDASKCSSFGNDCCANGTTEKQTCKSGFTPVRTATTCHSVNKYKCCRKKTSSSATPASTCQYK